MPEISRFLGIIIYMYGADHNPPHFHVKYNEFRAIVEIETGKLMNGYLPSKQLKLVQKWCSIHQIELYQNFESLNGVNQYFSKIKPLEL